MIMWLKRKIVLVFLCLFVLFVTSVFADTESKIYPKFTLESGVTYLGLFDVKTNTEAFLGVPFAEPPIGDLRWLPPKSIQDTEEIKLAKNFAPACFQGTHITDWYKDVAEGFGGNPDEILAPDVSEDCLYLNIWRPAKLKDREKIPVIIYIHGGSNKGGWSYEPNYIGRDLAKHGIVVVTIAYRLGVFGYFSHPNLTHSNFGLLDQIQAIKWINDNADRLNIDKSRIVVMGESAGANSIDFLVSSPLSKNLFTRIIHQSGGSSITGRAKRSEHLLLGERLGIKVSEGSEIDPIEKLKNLPAKEILTISSAIYDGHIFEPVVDMQSVIEPIRETIIKNELGRIDVLIGSNNDEWLMYMDGKQDIDDWLNQEAKFKNHKAIKEILATEQTDIRKIDLSRTAKYYVCPSLELADELSDQGGNAWFYNFTRQRAGELGSKMGAYHGAELPYVFNTHDSWLPTKEMDVALTDEIQKYWINFVKYGDPNGENLVLWPRFTKKTRSVLYIGDRYSTGSHYSEPLCEFF